MTEKKQTTQTKPNQDKQKQNETEQTENPTNVSTSNWSVSSAQKWPQDDFVILGSFLLLIRGMIKSPSLPVLPSA